MKAITDGDYTTEPVCKHLKKKLEYHALYVQSYYC